MLCRSRGDVSSEASMGSCTAFGGFQEDHEMSKKASPVSVAYGSELDLALL